MKNLYLTVFGLFCIGAFAQNSPTWPSTGNVGIGTSTPTVKLDVITSTSLFGSSQINLAYFGYRSTSTGSNSGLYFQHVGRAILDGQIATLYKSTKLSSVLANIPKSYLEFDTPHTANTDRA